MVGALAALASNFFFGQGPWTPWQMYAWGLVGYGAGLLAKLPAKQGAKRSANQNTSQSANSSEMGMPTKGGCSPETREASQPTHVIDKHPVIIYLYGFAACLMYGFILNAWSILSFYHAQASGLAGIVAVYAAAAPFDILHGAATVVFLAALYAPWHRKLERIKIKYGLR